MDCGSCDGADDSGTGDDSDTPDDPGTADDSGTPDDPGIPVDTDDSDTPKDTGDQDVEDLGSAGIVDDGTGDCLTSAGKAPECPGSIDITSLRFEVEACESGLSASCLTLEAILAAAPDSPLEERVGYRVSIEDLGTGNRLRYETEAEAGGPYECSISVNRGRSEVIDTAECGQLTGNAVMWSGINLGEAGPGSWFVSVFAVTEVDGEIVSDIASLASVSAP